MHKKRVTLKWYNGWMRMDKLSYSRCFMEKRIFFSHLQEENENYFSFFFHYDLVTKTHCNVWNWAPSISGCTKLLSTTPNLFLEVTSCFSFYVIDFIYEMCKCEMSTGFCQHITSSMTLTTFFSIILSIILIELFKIDKELQHARLRISSSPSIYRAL